jgi:hypothetical protein
MPYRLSMYYTADEVATWEVATGESFSDSSLVISRFDQPVSQTSSIDPYEHGRMVIRDTFGTGVCFSQKFNDGFGGYGLGYRSFCPDSLFISGSPIDSTYIARVIESNAHILAGRIVHYRAKDHIELLPDFEVDPNAIFTAEFFNCLVDNPNGSMPLGLPAPIVGQTYNRYIHPLPELSLEIDAAGRTMIRGIVTKKNEAVVRLLKGSNVYYEETLTVHPRIDAKYECVVPSEITPGSTIEVTTNFGTQTIKFIK